MRMSLYITINAKIDSRKLYDELRQFGINVLDLGEKTIAYLPIDIGYSEIERIIFICSKYGDISVRGKTIV